MDPLSAMASVVGLLAAAGQVASVLSKVKSGIKDAPRSMDHTISEVKAVEISLSAIQKFLLGLSSAPRERITMIQVDQLLATLTEAVLTFSDLEALVKPLATDSESSIIERIRWCWKEDDVSIIMKRLERHKSSLSLMLNIVQCESDVEAEQSRHMLHNLISQLLESNQEISRRLLNLEASHDSQSILTNCFRNGNTLEGVDITEEITQTDPDKRDSRTFSRFLTSFQPTPFHYSFEIDLNTSRVYRRTEPYKSDVSFTSSSVRTHAWSIFSGMSLSEISVVSALALPLYAYDIPNNEWYNFGEIELEVPMSGTRYQETINRPASSNTPTTKSTALSTIFAPLEKLPEELQLSTTPSPPPPVQVLTSRSTSGRMGRYGGYDRMVLYKLVVLGDEDVGKTSLTIQLTLQFFVETYDPTIEDSYRTRVVIDGSGCVLEILDTSHQEEYTALRDQWIRDGEGFVLVYSITKRSSFTRISRFYHQIKRVKEVQRSDPYGCCSAYAEQYLQPPVMLVGNNCERVTEREVSTEEGLALAQELGCEFVEASARNSINVDEAFFDVVRQIRRQRMAAAEERRIAKASNPQERKILPPLVHNYPRKTRWGYIKRK